LLLNERIDAFIGSEQRLNYLLQEQGLTDTILQQNYTVRDDRKVYLALSKRSEHSGLEESISKALRLIKSKGVFETPYTANHSE